MLTKEEKVAKYLKDSKEIADRLETMLKALGENVSRWQPDGTGGRQIELRLPDVTPGGSGWRGIFFRIMPEWDGHSARWRNVTGEVYMTSSILGSNATHKRKKDGTLSLQAVVDKTKAALDQYHKNQAAQKEYETNKAESDRLQAKELKGLAIPNDIEVERDVHSGSYNVKLVYPVRGLTVDGVRELISVVKRLSTPENF